MRREIVAICLLFLMLAPAISTDVAWGSTQTEQYDAFLTTDISVYGEFASFYMGKRAAIAMVLGCVGGNVEVPINTSWPEIRGLVALRIAAGIGHRWWLYYHHDIYPELPPMVTLITVYDLPRDAAISNATSLAEKLGSILGVKYYPLWSWTEDGKVFVLFTAELPLNETADFMRTHILSRFKDSGLSKFADSPVIDRDIEEERYVRAALTIVRDSWDVDRDNITDEFVPVLVLAAVLPDAIKDLGDGWYRLSIKEALNMPDIEIEPNPVANVSILKIHSYLPIEVDETRSVLPDNPLYEYSGKLIYVLKGRDSEKSYDDIYVVMKPFNFTEEIETMPRVTGAFWMRQPTEVDFHGRLAANVTYTVALKNIGRGEARNITVMLPIVGALRDLLNSTVEYFGGNISYSDVLGGGGWAIENVSMEGFATMALVARIDSLGANETAMLNFSLIVVFEVMERRHLKLLSPPMGPLYTYEDIEGKMYFGCTNGFTIVPRTTAVIAFLRPVRAEPVNASALIYRFYFQVVCHVFGNRIRNVRARLYLGRPEGVFRISDQRVVAESKTNSISDVYTFDLSFEARLRVGVWSIFATVDFHVDTPRKTLHLGFVTNSYMTYVPPAPWVILRWYRKHIFPYPHVELDILKNVSYDSGTRTMTIRLNITNIGDRNTTIVAAEFLLLRYVDISVGKKGIVDYRINGVSVLNETRIIIDSELGVIIVASPNITIEVNKTVTIEIRVKILSNYSGELVVRPTLIKYLFGRYAPDRIEKEEDQASECGSRTHGEVGGHKEQGGGRGDEENRLLRTLETSIHIMQAETTSALSTYTNAVMLIVTPPSGPRRPWRLIVFLTIVVGIMAATYVAVVKRKS